MVMIIKVMKVMLLVEVIVSVMKMIKDGSGNYGDIKEVMLKIMMMAIIWRNIHYWNSNKERFE